MERWANRMGSAGSIGEPPEVLDGHEPVLDSVLGVEQRPVRRHTRRFVDFKEEEHEARSARG